MWPVHLEQTEKMHLELPEYQLSVSPKWSSTRLSLNSTPTPTSPPQCSSEASYYFEQMTSHYPRTGFPFLNFFFLIAFKACLDLPPSYITETQTPKTSCSLSASVRPCWSYPEYQGDRAFAIRTPTLRNDLPEEIWLWSPCFNFIFVFFNLVFFVFWTGWLALIFSPLSILLLPLSDTLRTLNLMV